MTSYNDTNVLLCDGQELEDKNDIDMRLSMLMGIYLNLCICYMKLNHFKVAQEAIEEARKISEKTSQIFFRRS